MGIEIIRHALETIHPHNNHAKFPFMPFFAIFVQIYSDDFKLHDAAASTPAMS